MQNKETLKKKLCIFPVSFCFANKKYISFTIKFNTLTYELPEIVFYYIYTIYDEL